jgi:sugar (pentulose or hexulose) kinase
MTEKPLLAIDLGAGSGRVSLGILEGTKLEVREIHRFENRQVRLGGALYWDFLFLWDNVLRALSLCTSLGYAEPDSIGVNSWNCDFALVDGAGKLLGNPVSYRDRGAEEIGGEITSTIGVFDLYRETGIPLFTITGLARLLQMRKERADGLFDLARWYLPIPDLTRFFLTGEASVEETIAWGTQFVDIRSRTWSPRLIDSFNIPKRILPELVPAGTLAGSLSREITDITGVEPCPVVAVAEHDTTSAVLTAHYLDSEAAILSAGSWSILGAVIGAPVLTRRALDLGFMNEIAYGSVFLAKNMMGFFLLEQFLKSWRSKGTACDYDLVKKLAREAPAGAFRLDPNDPLFFSPSNLDTAFSEYCTKSGQDPVDGIGTIARSLFEGLASSYALALEELSGILKRPFSRLVVVGGGVRNSLFCELVANFCRVDVITGPAEATSTGNLCVQALALGRILEEDLGSLIKTSFDVRTYRPQTPR